MRENFFKPIRGSHDIRNLYIYICSIFYDFTNYEHFFYSGNFLINYFGLNTYNIIKKTILKKLY